MTENRRPVSISRLASRQWRGGYTLLEMLTTVAALIIVLGLMVSLARSVRSASAQELTKDLLRKLNALADQYDARYRQLPQIAPLVPVNDAPILEANLQRAAYQNNRQLVAALRSVAGLGSETFEGLPDAVFNESTLRDAWGTPIAFMPSLHPSLGTAPQNRRFFFSAGPDGQFLTQEDNLYSYEEVPLASQRGGRRLGKAAEEPTSSPPALKSAPGGTGHPE